MKPLAIALIALSFLGTASAEEGTGSDVEAWNRGVEYYRHGDYSNALQVLKPLVLSRTHGPRAAEVVAKLALSQSDYEAAARMAQIALRAQPDDARAHRNFTRATDRLPAWREQRRQEAILKAARDKDPGSMLLASTRSARQLMESAGTYRTNAAPVAIALGDRLSHTASSLADVWLPVRQTVAQSVTNQEQAATILQQLDQAEAKTRKAAKELGDLDGNAYSTLSEVEHDFTRFLKLTIPPPAAMAEDLVSQSNAWQDVAAFNGREWQRDALDYTRSFRAHFPAWARNYEQQAQSNTNMAPFKAEDQEKIAALSDQLEKLQLGCCEKSLPPDQERSLKLIRQIQELLPKDRNGGGQGQSGQPPDQQKPDQQPKPDQPQNPEQNQDQQNQDQRQDQDPNAQPPEPKESEAKDQPQEEQSSEDKAIEALLKKAQERNDEHEAEKKARMRKAALPPNEKDW